MENINLRKVLQWVLLIFVIQIISTTMVFIAFREVEKISYHRKLKSEASKTTKLIKERISYELENLHRVSELVAWNRDVSKKYSSITTSGLSDTLKKIKYKIMANEIKDWVVNLKIKGVEIGVRDGLSKIVSYSSDYPHEDIEKYNGKYINSFGETRDYTEVRNGKIYLKAVADIDDSGRLIVSKNIENYLDEAKETLKMEIVLISKRNNKPFVLATTIFQNDLRIKNIYLNEKVGSLVSSRYKKILLYNSDYEFFFEEIFDSKLNSIGFLGSGYSTKIVDEKYSIINVKIFLSIFILSILSTLIIILIFDKILKIFPRFEK